MQEGLNDFLGERTVLLRLRIVEECRVLIAKLQLLSIES